MVMCVCNAALAQEMINYEAVNNNEKRNRKRN